MKRGWSMRWALGLIWVGVSGCFLGYDSRWGQQKQAQRHVAAHETPEQLHRQSVGAAPRAPQRALKLRVYATPGYAAAVLDWPKQFAALLECVNAIFTPDFGVAFEVSRRESFRPKSDEEKLDGVLQELTQGDAAEDVDWVVGLASAVPRFAASADDLGRAPLLGRHLVMRAMSDVHEYEAIEAAFNELSEAERQSLYRARKQHKLCAVFVHELAHTLGVPHELSASSLMNPRYHVEASGLSEEAAKIVRASLATRAQPSHAVLDADLARNIHALLSAPNADWEAKSRDALLALIAPAETNAEAIASALPTSAKPASPAPSGPAIEGLSAQERGAVERARAELGAGRAARAREIAAPVFAAHPKLAALQSLRCEIAMGVGGDWEAIQSECPGLSPFGN